MEITIKHTLFHEISRKSLLLFLDFNTVTQSYFGHLSETLRVYNLNATYELSMYIEIACVGNVDKSYTTHTHILFYYSRSLFRFDIFSGDWVCN